MVQTPVRAARANAIAGRFVRTVRAECLDWLAILNRRHERVLRVYIDHYNQQRPHRALELRPPNPNGPAPDRLVPKSSAATSSAASSTSTTDPQHEMRPE